MTVYFIGFMSSTLFMWLTKREKRHKTLYLFLAILILSVISGIRDLNVGTDIRYYVLPNFIRAQQCLGKFWTFMLNNPEQMEILYLVIEYISAAWFDNIHFALFVFSLITNTFGALAINNLKDKLNPVLAWLAYCLLFYPISLNLMRQSMAIAIVFFIFSDENKLCWRRVIGFTILAASFHITGLIGIFLYIVYQLLESRITRKIGIKNFFFLILLFLPFLSSYLLQIAISVGVLHEKYQVFLNGDGNIALGNIVFRSFGLISFALLLSKKIELRKNNWYSFLLYVAFIDVLFLINNSLLASRIAKYFSVFEVAYFAVGMEVYKKKGGARLFVSIFILILMIVYWYYQFVVLNSGEIYPYMMDTKIF